ncbi:MAG: hypothetical protein LIR50_08590 [Bacillota bacterium]|nr:hypothetical protein [Bacillota bacterium]
MKKKIIFIILYSFFIFSGCTPSNSNITVYKNYDKAVNQLKHHSKGLTEINKEQPQDSPVKTAPVKENNKKTADTVNKASTAENTGSIDSFAEFYDFIYKALSSFNSTASANIINYNEKTYNLEVINKVLKDHPDIDYGFLGASGKVTTTGNESVMEISFKYSFSRDAMISMKKYSEEKSKSIIASSIKPSMSEFQKVLAIHNYIVNNTSYDTRKPIPLEAYTDYGVFRRQKAVCEGYSKAMYRLLTAVGIKSYLVKGYGNNQAHAWLIVRIGGKYTHVDPTWDDPITSNGENILSYKYFCLTDTQIAVSHSWDRNSYPACTTTEYNMKK